MANNLFGTDVVRGVAGVYPLNVSFALRLAKVLSQKACLNTKTVVIGQDTRISGDMIEAALCAGFSSSGINVITLGIVPTPLITLMVGELNADMAVMITASHNPYQDNGIKLINRDGYKFPDEFYAEIENLLTSEEDNNAAVSFGKIIHNSEIIENYIDRMRKIAPNYKALQGLRVVIDCA